MNKMLNLTQIQSLSYVNEKESIFQIHIIYNPNNKILVGT